MHGDRTDAYISLIVCRKVMTRPLLESGLFLSLSLFFSFTSRPSGDASRPKEEQPLLESDYATTCTSRRTACATPQKPSRKPRRIYKVERTESGERRR